MSADKVAFTSEVARILELPRRTWTEDELTFLVNELTEALRTAAGTMRLLPIQALGLHDIGVFGGGFGPVPVGDGKTLITLLAPYVLGARRPLLLLPANLIEKTHRERVELSKHWRIPTNIRILSYDMLSRAEHALELQRYEPDLILCDEVHRLKNRRAGVTRRVARYMHDKPDTKFVGLSGTVMRKSIKDFAHIARWALKDGAPVPKTNEEVEEWALALDEDVELLARKDPGALLRFATGDEVARNSKVVAARLGFQRRLLETPGVFASAGSGNAVGASIYVRGIVHGVAPVTEANFAKLRADWKTPDDWDLTSAAEVWMRARELALGFHGVWDPRPPAEWRYRRSAWKAFVREALSRSRTLDTELQVVHACDRGALEATALEAWRAVRDSFTPCPRDIWHDSSAIDACLGWMSKRPGVVWTEHNFFAEELSRRSGLPYYGAEGRTSSGAFIDDANPKQSIIASVDANREGRNRLVQWSRALIVSPPAGADWWEQIIGRFHRRGQEADALEIDVLIGCRENFEACMKALAGARAIRETTGKQQKLLLADVDLPREADVLRFAGARWAKSNSE